ncbi:hypothetical protein [Kitasatospora purpeofusca]|uniref:hypothetical protein n=1 Tax=Kitasatospora purpeofusca TaxID=67352 RepID=UPI0035DBC629
MPVTTVTACRGRSAGGPVPLAPATVDAHGPPFDLVSTRERTTGRVLTALGLLTVACGAATAADTPPSGK